MEQITAPENETVIMQWSIQQAAQSYPPCALVTHRDGDWNTEQSLSSENGGRGEKAAAHSKTSLIHLGLEVSLAVRRMAPEKGLIETDKH